MSLHILALILGFILDFLFGDPYWLWHPVKAIGALIVRLESWLYRGECSHKAQMWKGTILWAAVLVISGLCSFGLLFLTYRIHPLAGLLTECIMSYQLLAAKSLKTESMKVYDALKKNDKEKARQAVAMIVGRDTAALSAEGITKAAVETVAENTSDGEIAPLFYMFLGGAGLGMLYKAVNTMDSMLGYQNERYLYFGRTAAKMDDLWNLIPARLSAYLMIAASWLCGYDGRAAYRIYKRDRYQHKSPNSAHTEAVCAGALQIQLAGGAWYFGEYVKKPTIGDHIRLVETEDIRRANRLLYVSSCLCLAAGVMIRSLIAVLCGW